MFDMIQYALRSMNGDLSKIETSLNRLSREQIWARPRPSMNTVGNLCLHLAGAEYQRMASAIGGRPLIRERTREFTESGLSAEDLLGKLKEVRGITREVLSVLSEQDLSREIEVHFDPEDWARMLRHNPEYNPSSTYPPEPMSRIIQGMAVHYSYHTGQIVVLTKLLQDTEENLLRWKH